MHDPRVASRRRTASGSAPDRPWNGSGAVPERLWTGGPHAIARTRRTGRDALLRFAPLAPARAPPRPLSTAAADLDAFAVGQRWIVDTEAELGLGTLLEVEHRQITVVFLATGETRRYAKESAPLTRVAFVAGDRATSHEGWQLEVESVASRDGRLVYAGRRADTGEPAELDERDLDNFLKFRTPRDRLFAGLLDGHRWFELRRDVFEHRDRAARSPIRGLAGARVEVMPHQVHVAVEALSRQAPRLLLADEVGLGKTIEAGLILNAKLARREVRRALAIVPEALVHQWLVEMLRRFSLRFSIVDAERFEALAESAPEGNPFLAEQLVLVSTPTLLAPAGGGTEGGGDGGTGGATIGDAAVEAGFDLVIVDEAHHLEWTPEAASPAYALVERLARITPSVLLLTATPEQLGTGGHFARLRLLDPDRHADLEAFEAEERGFAGVARVAGKLADAEALSGDEIGALEALLGEPFEPGARATLGSSAALAASELPGRLVDRLVDRHGTGRSLLRNTRRAVAGFPERRYLPHALEDGADASLVDWLAGFLAARPGEKALLISAHRETVERLAEALRGVGIDAARFHEGMSIVERDRAAAWFADAEDGCRLLLCSEIGSEGRNFQFLNALVTIELPLSPDLLEQRIGRLDRIGQTRTVEIHVPAAPGSADARRARWYHEGLDAFETLATGGRAVVDELGGEAALLEALGETDPGETAVDALVARTREVAAAVEARLEAGRDRLLELVSNRPERVQEHLDAFAREARDPLLQDFMLRTLDRFGVDVAEQSGWWLLKPSDNMQLERFPLLPEGGMSVTFDRALALAREELAFLSWDHPMVVAAMDLILDEGYGQADAQVIRTPELAAGLAIVDASYALECTADPALGIERFLPGHVQRFAAGLDGRDWTATLERIDVNSVRVRYDRKRLREVVRRSRGPLQTLIDRTAAKADAALPALVAEARAGLDAEHAEARDRLVALARVNPAVDEAEVEALDRLRERRLEALGTAHARPVSVRVLFVN